MRVSLRIVLAAAVLALVTSQPVIASNDLGFRTSSDSYVSYSMYLLETTTHTSVHYSIDNNINPTDISAQPFHDIGGKEVMVFDSTGYGNTGWVGAFSCGNWGSTTVCLNGQVDLNLYYGPYGQVESDSIMCEELGHSAGLDHAPGSSSCMSQDPTKRLWDSHDKSIVNAHYP